MIPSLSSSLLVLKLQGDAGNNTCSKTGFSLFEISDDDGDSELDSDDEDDAMSMISLLICNRIDDNDLLVIVVVIVVGRFPEFSVDAEVMTMVRD